MRILILTVLLFCSYDVTACQNPPTRTEQDAIDWKAKIFDYREEHGDSVIIDIQFPLEFNGYSLTNIRLFKGNGQSANEFIFPIDTSSNDSVRALIGKNIIDELTLSVSYEDCGYMFNYKIGENGGNGV